MVVLDDLELPLTRMKFAGPGIDALERRKEENNNEEVKSTRLVENFLRVRGTLMGGLKAVTQAPFRFK